ncbi:Uncharacterised protein [Vibrio cholerae]|nr:Uncharacterised protein [Vibrio cholerae]
MKPRPHERALAYQSQGSLRYDVLSRIAGSLNNLAW